METNLVFIAADAPTPGVLLLRSGTTGHVGVFNPLVEVSEALGGTIGRLKGGRIKKVAFMFEYIVLLAS